jgi:superfamily II DNA/RNA helicase
MKRSVAPFMRSLYLIEDSRLWPYCRAEDLGFIYATEAQAEALPVLLSGRDCLLHSQVGNFT